MLLLNSKDSAIFKTSRRVSVHCCRHTLYESNWYKFHKGLLGCRCIVIGISMNHRIYRYFWYIPYGFWFKNRDLISLDWKYICTYNTRFKLRLIFYIQPVTLNLINTCINWNLILKHVKLVVRWKLMNGLIN